MTEQSKKKRPERAIARHGDVRGNGRLRAILGIFGKGLVVVLVSTLTVLGISAYQLTTELSRHQIHVVGLDGKAVEIPPLNGPLNLLLVGSDTREGTGNGVFGTEVSNLADVIILIHISADRKNAVGISFPRDLMVPWPACPSTTGGPGYLPQSLGQINATIANGGPGCTLLTVEQLTGLKIPYLAMIDFNGVIELSNAVGGVEVCVAKDINDPYTKTYLKAGMHNLQGLQALQFLRTRHGVGDGSDLSRISNQQVYLTALVRKLKSKDILNNPVALYSMAKAAARNMKLSDTLSDPGVMVGVADALKAIPMKKITFLQLPSLAMTGKYENRVQPDYEKAQILFDMMAADQPMVLGNVNNTGSGSEVAPTPTPTKTKTPKPSTSPSATPTPTVTPLPDWAQGTNAATTTCSKGQ
ncbi:MAG: LytR family transcriptional regulator [Micrococcales bacterium]|nr:LytR family transcriptional regulator [Micrococcales bacterium]NBR55295.1 LytR family transcriptional regulator [Micrococcales bacterium]NBR61629.1 LytR family transcriptional regulator [Actinomycetota bacterium]NBT48767.1 LytR family transcriptional regulator [Actinomycetota bacterium]NBY43985.1 LytR family transcriptional regulator [Micrococcales bacterium]